MASGAGASLRIFISYRRGDCQAQANGLNDGLRHRLPDAHIFMDIDSIPLGADFEQHIRDEIRACDVVLVLIGDEWLDMTDGQGTRRLDKPRDFVRLEVESALVEARVRVVPVLVEGAEVPPPDELPDGMRALTSRQCIYISDRNWQADLRRLSEELQRLTPQRSAGETRRDVGPAGSARRPKMPPVEDADHLGAAKRSATIGMRDLEDEAIADAVSTMGAQFQTKDISELCAARHGARGRAYNYPTMVGRYLSTHGTALGIRSVGKASNGRGERWQKLATASGTSATGVTNGDSSLDVAISEALADLGASRTVVAFVRDVAVQNPVMSDRRGNYVSLRPAGGRAAIAMYVHSHQISFALEPAQAEDALLVFPDSRLEQRGPSTWYLVVQGEDLWEAHQAGFDLAVTALNRASHLTGRIRRPREVPRD